MDKRLHKNGSPCSFRYPRFKKGEKVTFKAWDREYTGTITRVIPDGGINYYHIQTNKLWFKDIEETQVSRLTEPHKNLHK